MPVREPAPPGNPPDSEPPSGVRRRPPGEDAASGRAAGTDVPTFAARGAPSAEVIARELGVSVVEAEEIRQATFEAMLAVNEPIRAPLAWFWETARRRRCRLLRSNARARRHEPELLLLGQQQQAPFPSPDAGIERRELERAVEQVLARVKPSRRGVAELRLAGYSESEVAARLNKPVGTVRSMWARAREDAGAHWAALLAALAALWLWLLRRGRRDGNDAPEPGSRRRAAGALFACAALSFTITTHSSGRGAAAVPDATADAEASIAGASAEPVRFAPFLTTNAERERDSANPPAVRGVWARSDPLALSASAPRVSGRASVAPIAPSAALVPRSRAWLEAARGHLVLAHRALWQEHDREKARGILELYEATFPEDPVPDQHAELVSALRAP